MNVYSIGKERLYLVVAAAIVIIVAGAGYASWRYKENKLQQVQQELRDVSINYEVVKGKLVQADNTKVVDVEQLKKDLSANFQKQIDAQKMQILAAVRADLKIWGGGSGTGVGTSTDGDPKKPINHFEYSDELMQKITVDTPNPLKPHFDYKIRPFTITVDSVLNFSKKDGTVRLWAEPRATGIPKQLGFEIPNLELRPSAEFNRWITDLSGDKTTVAVPAKYTINALMGKDFTPGLYQPKTVYGLQLQYNWVGGLGAGVGVIGNTTFISGGYSWGKH